MNKPESYFHATAIKGEEHWTHKPDGARLFLWNKCNGDPLATKGTIFFVHGSSMASQPTFDLQVPGQPYSSVMDWFAERGYDTWCADMEGYGRSEKSRDNNASIARGADDCKAIADYIAKLRGPRPLLLYGVSSGALRAAMFAERNPSQVGRLALDAMVWTGKDSATLAERRTKLPEFQKNNRRAIDKAFLKTVFDRDYPGTAEPAVIEAYIEAIVTLDDSMPTGTYVDMCTKLPIVDPKGLTMPTILMRGQWDGLASLDDLIEFFRCLPNPDKHFAMLPGISHGSFHQKNRVLAYHILDSFFLQPEPIYRG